MQVGNEFLLLKKKLAKYKTIFLSSILTLFPSFPLQYSSPLPHCPPFVSNLHILFLLF